MNKRMVCVWREEDNFHETFWESDCDKSFVFTQGGTPADNNFAFCPFCGKVMNGRQIDLANLERIRELAE